jgi:hypothetical protein
MEETRDAASEALGVSLPFCGHPTDDECCAVGPSGMSTCAPAWPDRTLTPGSLIGLKEANRQQLDEYVSLRTNSFR